MPSLIYILAGLIVNVRSGDDGALPTKFGLIQAVLDPTLACRQPLLYIHAHSKTLHVYPKGTLRFPTKRSGMQGFSSFFVPMSRPHAETYA